MRAFLSAILLGIGCAAAVACGDDKKVVNACPDGEEGCSCLEGNLANPRQPAARSCRGPHNDRSVALWAAAPSAMGMLR